MADQPAGQTGYDPVARVYAERLAGELADKPFDRAFLDRFARLAQPIGPVCDLGCGPGHVGDYLRRQGCEVIGLDPSPGMLAEGRRFFPEIAFVEGAVPGLPLDGASLGGIVAFYSIIHVRREDLPAAFEDCRRVLRPGGGMAIAFHIGTGHEHRDEMWGVPVDITAYAFSSEEIVGHLTGAGFEIVERAERDPYSPEVEHQSRRAYLMARRIDHG